MRCVGGKRTPPLRREPRFSTRIHPRNLMNCSHGDRSLAPGGVILQKTTFLGTWPFGQAMRTVWPPKTGHHKHRTGGSRPKSCVGEFFGWVGGKNGIPYRTGRPKWMNLQKHLVFFMFLVILHGKMCIRRGHRPGGRTHRSQRCVGGKRTPPRRREPRFCTRIHRRNLMKCSPGDRSLARRGIILQKNTIPGHRAIWPGYEDRLATKNRPPQTQDWRK